MKMTNRVLFFLLMIIGIGLILTISCKKNDTHTVPVLTTSDIKDITQITATGSGQITSDGGSPITISGICWNTNEDPSITDEKTTNGTISGSYTCQITALMPGTIYYARAYATNSIGTGYGNVVSFTTQNIVILFNHKLIYGTVTDIDGNVYKTITIGTQTWMAENLKTTHYRNGDPIPNVADSIAWSVGNLSTGAYCDYKNTPGYSATYGKLYNWYAVGDNRILCPKGWHIPTDIEWTTLINYLGGASIAGNKLRETGVANWLSPNTGATNESGFTALPGGNRYPLGQFNEINSLSSWWGSENIQVGSAYAWLVGISSPYLNNVFMFTNNKSFGLSVRCVKD